MSNEMRDEALGTRVLTGSYDLKNENLMSGIVNKLTRKFGGGTQRSTQDLIREGMKKKKPSPDAPDADALEGVLEEAAEAKVERIPTPEPEPTPTMEPGPRMTPEEVVAAKADPADLEPRNEFRNINVEYVSNVEEIGGILEEAAKRMGPAPVQAMEEIRGNVDAKGHLETLKEVLGDSQNRNLTSEQLLAGREILVTLMTETEALAEKITKGQANTEDMLRFDRTQLQAVTMQRFMQGAVRETGRALNSLKLVARALDAADLAEMEGMTAGSDYTNRARLMLEAKKSGATRAEQIKLAEETYKFRDLMSAMVNIRNASILTGFKTQGVNLVSNTGYGLLDSLAIKPIAAGIGRVRTLAGIGGDERVVMGEVGADVLGAFQGFSDAITMGKDLWVDGTFKNGGEYISEFGGKKIDEVVDSQPLLGDAITNIVPGAKWTGVPQVANAYQRVQESISFGLLSATDEFYKGIAYRKVLTSMAYRRAVADGLEGDALVNRVNEILLDVPYDIHTKAIEESQRLTFTNRDDVWKPMQWTGDLLVKLGQVVPLFRLVFPFVRTPTALFDRSLKSFAPTAIIQKEFRDRVAAGGPDADMALAEMSLGTGIVLMAYGMYQNGSITGDGPEDYTARKVLMDAGWQPKSVVVDGTQVSIARGFEPFSTAVIGLVSQLDRIHYAQTEQEAEEILVGTIFAAAKHFKDNTYMAGVADLMAVMDGRMKWEAFAARQAAGYVPSLMRDVADFTRAATGEKTTPYIPSSHSFWKMLEESARTRVPGQKPQAIRRTWAGDPFIPTGESPMFIWNKVMPIATRYQQGKNKTQLDPESNVLIKAGIGVTPPSAKVSLEEGGAVSGIKVDLLDDLDNGLELYDKLVEMVGKARRRAVREVMRSQAFKKAGDYVQPGSDHALLLERALAEGAMVGRSEWRGWLQDQPLPVEKYGEKVKYLRQADLKDTLKAVDRKLLTPDEKKELARQGAKGMPSRDPIKPPVYVPDI